MSADAFDTMSIQFWMSPDTARPKLDLRLQTSNFSACSRQYVCALLLPIGHLNPAGCSDRRYRLRTRLSEATHQLRLASRSAITAVGSHRLRISSTRC